MWLHGINHNIVFWLIYWQLRRWKVDFLFDKIPENKKNIFYTHLHHLSCLKVVPATTHDPWTPFFPNGRRENINRLITYEMKSEIFCLVKFRKIRQMTFIPIYIIWHTKKWFQPTPCLTHGPPEIYFYFPYKTGKYIQMDGDVNSICIGIFKTSLMLSVMLFVGVCTDPPSCHWKHLIYN